MVSPPLLISLLANEFLRNALEKDDSQNSIIANAALVYLAALRYASSEYQRTKDICSAVLIEQTTHMDNETLNASCLFFNDDIDRIIEFCFQKEYGCFQETDLFRPMSYTKVFDYYLMTLSTENVSKQLKSTINLPTSAAPLNQVVDVFS